MRVANLSGRLVVVVEGGVVDVEEASKGRFAADPQAVYDRWEEFASWVGDADLGVADERPVDASYELRAPLPGDYGWIVKRHAELYAQEYRWLEPFEGLCAQIVAPYPPAGRIAIASQSGNFVSSFENWSTQTGVGVSRAVSAGNAAAVNAAADGASGKARKAARRGLNVLKARGVKVPDTTRVVNVAGDKGAETLEAWLLAPDGNGASLVTITSRSPTSRYKAVLVLLASGGGRVVVDAVAAIAEERAPAGTGPEAAAFVRSYYERVADEDLQLARPIDLYGAAMAHRRTGQVRPADGPQPELPRAVGRERARGLGHPVHVQDLQAEPGEELDHVDRQRRRPAGHHLRLAQAEQRPDRDRLERLDRRRLRHAAATDRTAAAIRSTDGSVASSSVRA